MSEKNEEIRQATLQIINERISRGEKGYVLSKEVAKKLGTTHASAALTLHTHYDEWGLVRDNILKERGKNPSVMAYAMRMEDIPYKPREKTPEEIMEIKLKRAKDRGLPGLPIEKEKLPLPKGISTLIAEIHEKEGNADFNRITAGLWKVLGRNPKSDHILLAKEIYEKEIESGKYVWNKEEGYSTKPE